MTAIAELRSEPAQCWHLAGFKPVVTARRIVGHECRQLGLTDSSVDDAVLAVDELATNAVLHGTSPYELRLYLNPAGWGVVDHADGVAVIRACLSKACAFAPVMEEFPPPESGRGLLLVGGLYPRTCCVRATVDEWGRPSKEVAFALPGARSQATVAEVTTERRPGVSLPLAVSGQRGR